DVPAGDDFLAGDALTLSDFFGPQHGIVDSAIVIVLADLLLGGLAQPLVDDILDDILNGRKICADPVDVESQIPPRVATRWTQIIFAARVPDADEMIHREADPDGLLDGGRVHRAPAPHQHPVRAVAADAQPLGRLVLH